MAERLLDVTRPTTAPEGAIMTACQFEYEAAGPHPGCAEFSPTVYHVCGADVAEVVTFEDAYDAALGEVQTLPLCASHVSDLLHEVAASTTNLTLVSRTPVTA